jgi:pimeloyl-ACP methyl ester carboxylesterase
MNAFGLVHGGGLGAWCWASVVSEMEKRGHQVAAVDLSPDDSAAGACRCAEIVAGAFAAMPDDLVLVGHSIAGLFLPLVAARRPLRRMVFLHALLPRPGLSVVDQMEVEADMFNPEMFAAEKPFWEDEATAFHFLLHDCQPEVVRESFRRLRPEPGVLGQEVSSLAVWPDVPSTYIVCNDDRTATPSWARRAAHERLAVEPLELNSGHCPMLSQPKVFTDLLCGCA